MKRVVCVSNSRSLVGSGLGEIIDSCDEVVRFNGFETKGFENDVGARTTIWIHSNEVPRSHFQQADCRKIFAVPNWKRAELTIDSDIEVIPPSVEEQIREHFDFPTSCWPTTGLLGLAYLLRDRQPIHVCGWLPSTAVSSFRPHYYGGKSQSRKGIRERIDLLLHDLGVRGYHALRTEKQIVKRWCDDGMVIPLESTQ